MHNLLSDWLNKLGIKDVKELSPEERATFENYKLILDKEELTIGDIKEFCNTMIATIEGKWKDLSIENAKKAELIPYHTILKMLLAAITSPKVAREQVEKQLQQLISQ